MERLFTACEFFLMINANHKILTFSIQDIHKFLTNFQQIC